MPTKASSASSAVSMLTARSEMLAEDSDNEETNLFVTPNHHGVCVLVKMKKRKLTKTGELDYMVQWRLQPSHVCLIL